MVQKPTIIRRRSNTFTNGVISRDMMDFMDPKKDVPGTLLRIF